MTDREFKYDMLVIGSGPGGEGAAMQASKEGLKVAVIEEKPSVGGNCTHLGTIPSKTVRHLAHRLTTFQTDPLFNKKLFNSFIGFPELMERASTVIRKQVKRRESHYLRNDIDVYFGRGSLLDKHTVQVDLLEGKKKQFTAKSIVLATGSRPYRAPCFDFEHPLIHDSDSVLHMKDHPKSITVIGAGVIGCEYTSIFKALGCRVTLVNNRSQLLSFLDEEITDALSYHLREKGVTIRNNEIYSEAIPKSDGVITHLKSGKKIKSDVLLVAMGRQGNTDGLNLGDLGVKTTHKGLVEVNGHYQTSVENIYAVGDLTGFPSLASSAYDQGRFAALHIVNPLCDDSLVKDIPVGIYTSPEISCIGRTEKELTEDKVPYEIGHVAFKNLARAQITGQTVGMLKLLFHVETLEILGIHCFGQNSAEILHIGQAIMAQPKPGNSLKYFVNTTFNYPTMGEAYRVAALNGMNRLRF